MMLSLNLLQTFALQILSFLKENQVRIFLSLLLMLAFATASRSQVKHPVIQFTGVVMEQDSMKVIPGVHIYLPKSGRGTTTNPYGFFSLPVEVGDSIIFTAVGFKRTHYIIPEHDKSVSLKVIVTLEEDVTFLEEVQVFPFPTEEMFKRAVVTMELPYSRDQANLRAWLSATYMQDGYGYYAASPAMTQRYFQDQQVLQFQQKFGPSPQTNLLNPWAWSSFINSLRGN